MRSWLAIIVSSLIATQAALAQQPHSLVELRRLMNNTQQDMSDCVVYFQIISRCTAANPGGTATSAGYSKAADDLMEKSFILGKKAGLSNDAMQSRLTLAAKDMMATLQNDCVNISSLLSRHMDRCQEVAHNPLKPLQKSLPPK
jgi:hypothetical protein